MEEAFGENQAGGVDGENQANEVDNENQVDGENEVPELNQEVVGEEAEANNQEPDPIALPPVRPERANNNNNHNNAGSKKNRKLAKV